MLKLKSKLVPILFLFQCSLFAGEVELHKQFPSVEIQDCQNRFQLQIPEAQILAEKGEWIIPYQVFRIALPNDQIVPAIQWKEAQYKKLEGFPARVGECPADLDFPNRSKADHQQVLPSIHWGPAIKTEGVWIRSLYIPLVQKNGTQWQLVQSLHITVQWKDYTAIQSNAVPTRLLRKVENPNDLKKFYRKPISTRLAKRNDGFPSNSEWLAKISVGDKDVSTTNEDGMYRILFNDVKSALEKVGLGSQMDGIPIEKLTLWSGSPDTLREVPQSSVPSYSPLFEVPLWVIDSQKDGTWNQGDTLYFYGSGTSIWKKMSLEDSSLSVPGMEYYYSTHPHSFYSNYYLGVKDLEDGKRLLSNPSYSNGSSITQVTRYVRAEKDLLLRDASFGWQSGFEDNSGSEWFWVWTDSYSLEVPIESEVLNLPQVTTLPGLIGDSAKLAVSFFPHRTIEQSYSTTYPSPIGTVKSSYATLSLSGQSLDNRFSVLKWKFFANENLAEYDSIRQPKGQFVHTLKGLTSNGNTFRATVGPNSRQWDRFDGFSIGYPFQLQWLDTNNTILPGSITGKRTFQVANLPSDAQVLKIVNGIPSSIISTQSTGFTDSIVNGTDTRYYLHRKSRSNLPASIEAWKPVQGTLDLTNLQGDYEYVIISARDWAANALELAELRSSNQVGTPLRTAVVDLEDIALHFGAGIPSAIAIRDFLRMARSTWPSLEYVTLLGDGHADTRQIRPSSSNVFVPTFEKEDLASDDFFALLDSGEQITYGVYDRDLAIGRLPVNSPSDVLAYIEKLKEYEVLNEQSNGVWRNRILLVADDHVVVDHLDPAGDHTQDAEAVEYQIKSESLNKGFQVDIQKLYLMAYKANLKKQKPEATRDLITRINQGTLLTLYFGHGSSVMWADEYLLKISDLAEVKNQGRYTILSSFACTVGRFDLPNSPSLSEAFLFTERKGAIASIGAMRETYPIYNRQLAMDLTKNIYIDSAPNIGWAFAYAKGMTNSSYTGQRFNSEKYVLIGEPVLSIPLPNTKVEITPEVDTLQALQRVRLKGKVDQGGSGQYALEVLAGAEVRTLQEQVPNSKTRTNNVEFQGTMLHSQSGDYSNGNFDIDFIMPRKVKFGDTAVQIRTLVWANGKTTYGHGLAKSITLWGTSDYSDSLNDTIAPSIEFRPCGIPDSLNRSWNQRLPVTLEIPGCVEVVIKDSTGIDMREEADEGISFEVLNHQDAWHPWSFIEQTGKRVIARMDLNDSWLPGTYQFQVQAQDILGNRNKQLLQIDLQASLTQALQFVFNAPNPMGNKGTTFYFRDLASHHKSVVSIEIFAQNGRLVKAIRDVHSGETQWDGRDQRGRLLANGLYYYVVRATVFPSEEGGKNQVYQYKQKLVISR